MFSITNKYYTAYQAGLTDLKEPQQMHAFIQKQ